MKLSKRIYETSNAVLYLVEICILNHLTINRQTKGNGKNRKLMAVGRRKYLFRGQKRPTKTFQFVYDQWKIYWAILHGLWPAAKTNCKRQKRGDSKLKSGGQKKKSTKKGNEEAEGVLLLHSNEMQTHKFPTDKTRRGHCLTLKTAKSWGKGECSGAKTCSSVAALIYFGFLVHSNGVFACGLSISWNQNQNRRRTMLN